MRSRQDLGRFVRGDFRNMLVTRISHYERLVHHEEVRTIWRYAFLSVNDGRKFVYSGVFQPLLHQGNTCAFRASCTLVPDEYGLFRLKRLVVIENMETMI